MLELPEKPFFIIGHPRSGTTLLRFILGSHPRLSIPEETGFFPFLLSKNEINTSLSIKQVTRILIRIGKLNYLWRNKVRDVNSFYRSLPQPKLTYILDEILRHYTTSDPVIRWGDKTPLYVQYIPIINEIFPEAQFIHIIRDGRDAALSARQKWPNRSIYMDLYYLLKHWKRNVMAGKFTGQKLGIERYHEIFYEDLVTNPQETINRLCLFLNEEIHPAMLDHTVLASKIGPGPDNHIEILKPITTTSINRWKWELTTYEKKLADQVVGDTLTSLGYEQSALGRFTNIEQLQYRASSIKFILVDTMRSLLYTSGLLTLNRTMRKA